MYFFPRKRIRGFCEILNGNSLFLFSSSFSHGVSHQALAMCALETCCFNVLFYFITERGNFQFKKG